MGAVRRASAALVLVMLAGCGSGGGGAAPDSGGGGGGTEGSGGGSAGGGSGGGVTQPGDGGVSIPPASDSVQVLVDARSSSEVVLWRFPAGRVSSAQVSELALDGSGSSVRWAAEAPTADQALDAGQSLTVGFTPPGWVEHTPFGGTFTPGATFVFELTDVAGARAVGFHTFASTSPPAVTIPTVSMVQAGGDVVAWLTPALPVLQVALKKDGTTLWQATAANDAGAALPSDGLALGFGLDAGLLAPSWPLPYQLGDQESYQVSFTVPASATHGASDVLVSRTFTYRAPSSAGQFLPEMKGPAYAVAQGYSFQAVGTILEYPGHVLAYLPFGDPPPQGSTQPTSILLPISDLWSEHRTNFLCLEPGHGSTSTSTDRFSSLGDAVSLSRRPIARGGPGEVAMAVVGRTASGTQSVLVIESKPLTVFELGPFSFKPAVSDNWSVVGTTALTGLSDTGYEPASLSRAPLDGFSQDPSAPYVLSIVDQGTGTVHVIYPGTTSWQSVPVTGLVPTGRTATKITTAVVGGSLYACLVSRSGSSVAATLAKFATRTHAWVALANVDDSSSSTCFLGAASDGVYSVLAAGPRLDVRRLDDPNTPLPIDLEAMLGLSLWPSTDGGPAGSVTVEDVAVGPTGALLLGLTVSPAVGHASQLALVGHTAAGWATKVTGTPSQSPWFNTATNPDLALSLVRIGADGESLVLAAKEVVSDSTGGNFTQYGMTLRLSR